MRRPIATLLLVLHAGTACYRYTPADPGDITPGSTVRVRMNDAQTRRFAGIVPEDRRVVEGTVVLQRPDTMLIDVAIHTDVRGTRVESLNQRIDLPRDGLIEVELRELDRGKTSLVLGGATLLVTLAIASTLSGAFRSDRTNPDPGQELVVPVFFRIRW
jgi:hypothetical protein